MAMISTKKLIKMARKWQKFAAMQRKRISFSRNGSDTDSCTTSSSSTVEKGHFVVYTDDQVRFVIPLAYLKNEVIGKLFNMSEEEFGLPSGGPITILCDSAFMDYIISLIRKGAAAGDLNKALLLSIPSCCCSTQLQEILTKRYSYQFLHVAVRLLLCTKKVETNSFLSVEP